MDIQRISAESDEAIFWNRRGWKIALVGFPWCPCRWVSLQKVSILDTGEIIQLERVCYILWPAKEEYETLIIGIIWKRWRKVHWLDLVGACTWEEMMAILLCPSHGGYFWSVGLVLASFSTTCDPLASSPPSASSSSWRDSARNDHCQHTQPSSVYPSPWIQSPDYWV